METNDALGNPIEIGSKYGYSQSGNGTSTVTIGEVTHFTPTNKVTLKPILKRQGIYDHEPTERSLPSSVTVKPVILFPVNM